jgi:hypothetical protein
MWFFLQMKDFRARFLFLDPYDRDRLQDVLEAKCEDNIKVGSR